jgi:N-acetyltransferase
MFDFQPRLQGELITIRPYKAEDWDALLAAASDPLIWEQHPIQVNWNPENFKRSVDSALEDEGGLAVIDSSSGKVIGFSRYTTQFVDTGEVEIGWTFLARAYWGGRYNGELKRLMLTHALASWPTVVFRIGENNWRSRKALEKIGGTLMDRTQVVKFAGAEHLHVCYAMTRHAFARSPLIIRDGQA